MSKANEILTAAVATLDQRGRDYDQPGGERSMGRIVAAFNALTDHEMTEAEGWQFMACLKLVRMQAAADQTDSAVDCAAYAALAGEALAIDKERSERNKAALEKARAADPEPDAGGWIPWAGRECPVDEDVKVHIATRNGRHVFDPRAGNWRWAISPEWCPEYDIIAYRVVSEAPAAEKEDEPWKPGDGEIYYTLDTDGDPWGTPFDASTHYDRVRVAFGNCFRTREEAEAKRAEIIGGST